MAMEGSKTKEEERLKGRVDYINRVASIPLVNHTFSAVHSSLISNPLTRSPYTTAQTLSLTALRASEPIAAKLAPIIVRADGFANKGLDVVESRYPYFLTVQSEDILKALKERSDYARDVANKTIDERVRTPAYSAAQGIDQRFAPVVDYLIARLGTQENPSQIESKYQYQRAYALSRDLKDQILDYSNAQLQQLQNSSVLVQRATETAKSIQNVASSSVVAAQAKVSTLSDTMVSELQKIQAATAGLPANLQASFKPVQEGIASTISDLSGVIKSDLPVNEKFTKLRSTVQDHVTPILNTASVRLQDAIRSLTERVDAAGENGAPQSTEKSDGAPR
ncbi:lipid droplet-associated perilipin protein [Russula brevipes]|nr:lipid droplet-associated perilipin protein [Russula brevipes]